MQLGFWSSCQVKAFVGSGFDDLLTTILSTDSHNLGTARKKATAGRLKWLKSFVCGRLLVRYVDIHFQGISILDKQTHHFLITL